MGGVAALAKQSGFKVTGCDPETNAGFKANVYPPMSTQLEAQGITLIEGYSPEQTQLNPDVYIIGNAVCRGNPLMDGNFKSGVTLIALWASALAKHSRMTCAVYPPMSTQLEAQGITLIEWLLQPEQTQLKPRCLYHWQC